MRTISIEPLTREAYAPFGQVIEIEGAQGFSNYLWDFVDGAPVQNNLRHMGQMQTESDMSRALSKDLKARGFKFCGPTIIYAFAQAVGMVNDHLVDCCRHQACANLACTTPGHKN